MKGGQEGIRMEILIRLFHCAENDLLSPSPQIFTIVFHKDKRHIWVCSVCSVVRKIKERIQVPHLL